MWLKQKNAGMLIYSYKIIYVYFMPVFATLSMGFLDEKKCLCYDVFMFSFSCN